jgi:hypothetical protein
MSEAGFRWPSRETSGGPQGHVPSASEGRNQWDLPMEGTLGSRKSHRWRGAEETGSGFLRKARETGWTGVSDRGCLESPRRTRDWPTTLTRVAARTTGGLLGDWKRGKWLQRVSAPSSALPPEVGDAGNGYLASSWTVSFRCLRSRVGDGTKRVATGRTAQAASSGVGGLADARDN